MATEQQIARFEELMLLGSQIPHRRLMAADTLRKYGFEPEAVSLGGASDSLKKRFDYLMSLSCYDMPDELKQLAREKTLSSSEMYAIQHATFQTFTAFGEPPLPFTLHVPTRAELRTSIGGILDRFEHKGPSTRKRCMTIGQLKCLISMGIHGCSIPDDLMTFAMRNMFSAYEVSQLIDIEHLLNGTPARA